MKIKNYLAVIFFALLVITSVIAGKQTENEVFDALIVYEEDICAAVSDYCEIYLDYNRLCLELLEKKYSGNFNLTEFQKDFMSYAEMKEKVLNSNLYLLLEDGTYMTSKDIHGSMSTTLTQSEIEELNSLYDEIKDTMYYQNHKKFVKSKTGYTSFMGMPIYDNDYRFLGIVATDMNTSDFTYIFANIFKTDLKINVKIETKDNVIYENNKYDPSNKSGKTVQTEKYFGIIDSTMSITEKMFYVSTSLRITRFILLSLFGVFIIYFYIAFKLNKNGQSIYVLHAMGVIGTLIIVLLALVDARFKVTIQDMNIVTANNFTQMINELEDIRYEREIKRIISRIENDINENIITKENFKETLLSKYKTQIKTAIEHIPEITNVYVYSNDGSMIMLPDREKYLINVVDEKVYAEALHHPFELFIKEGIDINTERNTIFMYCPCVKDKEVIGVILVTLDSKSVSKNITRYKIADSIKKYVINDNVISSIDNENEILDELYYENDISGEGHWEVDNGIEQKKIKLINKNNNKEVEYFAVESKYTNKKIFFKNDYYIYYRDGYTDIVLCGLIYTILVIIFVNRITNVKKYSDEINDVKNTRLKIKTK
ncbi:MAG: cache domain-containing protein [Clostridia bacterium]|nr:cache domain-containing protein [Clostridia bacterium]